MNAMKEIEALKVEEGEKVSVHFETGEIRNINKNITLPCAPFSEVQMEIYQNNGLF
jgi:3-isopropylmalate dehydratase small subunit